MPPSNDTQKGGKNKEKQVCRWIDLKHALHHFAIDTGPTQSQKHIKPLHWYVACRLVLEGGFRPEEVTPQPPFVLVEKAGEKILQFDGSQATGSERTLLGGLKTKNVDVVVTKRGIGPVMAVSCKGAIGAFRNLTNRMEEAVGDCTNLHITYPAMVCGYLVVLRANRETEPALVQIEPERAPSARKLAANDIAIQKGGEPVEAVLRFHSALRELTGRRGIRNDVSRYEAVSMALIEPVGTEAGAVLPQFPPGDSPLRIEQFFQTLYLRYDERYVYSAPDLKRVTSRLEWSSSSPIFDRQVAAVPPYPPLDFPPRVADVPEEDQ